MNDRVALPIEAAPVDYDPFAGEAIARVVPTTEPQREVWLADRQGREASLAFNESVSLRLRGSLDPEALKGAVGDLAARHEALRSTLGAEGGELAIAAGATADVRFEDLSGASAPQAQVESARLRAVTTPFDLANGPLLRAEVLRLAPDDHLLVLAAHHIVCDGWSFGVLVGELPRLYALRAGLAGEALAPAASFGDYAIAQAQAAGGAGARADEAWWLAKLAGPLPVLDLPADRPRPAWRSFASLREDHVLDAALVADVRKLAAGHGAGLFGALLAGFAAFLHRVAGATDVVVGVPAAGQSVGGLASLVGHCVNLLPLRLAVDPAATAGELVAATQSAVLDAYEHQGCTFGTLLRKLAIERDASRPPLVSVMFNVDQALDEDAIGFPGIAAQFESIPRRYENFELFVNAVQAKGALRLECQYNTDLFDAATVRRWLAGYETLLRSACANARTPVGRLEMTGPADRALLARWNETAAPRDPSLAVHELFEAQARRAPGRIALLHRKARSTYAELDGQSNRIAHALRARGVRRGSLVGLHLERGPGLVAAMLGILKAGAGYVPLDPAYPSDRLAFMAKDAGLALLVTQAAHSRAIDWPAGRALRLDADAAAIDALPDTPLAPDGDGARALDVAYVIYTSGSTGKPKGVKVPHGAVVNFLQSMAREPGLGEDDRLLAVTTVSFDIAVNEIFLPLAVGAQVVLAAPEESGDGATLAALIEESGATVMQATPATWRLLLEAGWTGSPRFKALCGGESLGADLAGRLLERTGSLWNMYGPTETTVWSTCARIADAAGVTIGRPIANTTVWILDEAREPCPIGVPGEMWIGGDGVTLGYHDRPELTAERFVPDPFAAAQGARLYRTGDRGRWRADGTLEHLGRLDFQVKVRGYRIELGEIEAGLAAHDGVAQCVVMAREDRPGDVRLVAYVVGRPGRAPDEEALKAHLRAALPEYMIPQHVVAMAAIPLLPNGKVDRKALPAPQAGADAQREYAGPRDELEAKVAKEMESSLGMPGVGIHEDFFALGGHSLLAAQLTSRLNRAFGTHLTMRTLFAAPTVARLAEAIREAGNAPAAARRKPLVRLATPGEAPLSLMQERLWFLDELYPGRVTYNAPSAHRLVGALDEPAFQRAFAEMVRRQTVLRTGFEARDGMAVQRIHDLAPAGLFPAEDLSGLEPGEREARLAQRLEELAAQTFDLTQPPLFKAHMFRMGPSEHVFFFMPHHIVWDGWSFDLLYDEMSALYGAFAQGLPSPLPDLRFTYGDFAAWHRDWTGGEEFREQLSFWRSRLERIAAAKELPADYPRRPAMTGAGNTEWLGVDRNRTEALHEIGRRAGATLFLTTLAAYCVLLEGYSGQTALVVGTPVRGRGAAELETIMGYFNNLVPLPIDVDPKESFTSLLARVKAVVVECFACPDVPLERLSGELAGKTSTARPLLYQALYSFQDARQRVTRWGGLGHRMVPLFQKGATEDLGLWFVESLEGLQGGVTYNADLFTQATARRLRDGFLSLLDAIIARPEATVEALVGPDGAGILAHVPDAAALAMPVASVQAPRDCAPVAPATETERLLAAIWCEQLKLAQVDGRDNFFDLGGHSLLAMQAILAMEAKTGKRIDRNRYIFESLAQISRAYDEAQPEAPARAGGIRGLFSALRGGKKA